MTKDEIELKYKKAIYFIKKYEYLRFAHIADIQKKEHKKFITIRFYISSRSVLRHQESKKCTRPYTRPQNRLLLLDYVSPRADLEDINS